MGRVLMRLAASLPLPLLHAAGTMLGWQGPPLGAIVMPPQDRTHCAA